MKILIVAVGQKMPDWVKTASDEYLKRLPSNEYQITLREIKAEPRNTGKTPQQLMQAEAQRILEAVPSDYELWALDEHGKDLNTMQLAECMRSWQTLNQNVALVIGGPDGLDKQLKQAAKRLLRLSSLTLPHPMVRVILAEQLYRGWSILNNHPYHRA
ncbi:23S rRNA (pseudouridine(1915)-N(3))-methyltransferase RlmH [Brackiella oedipodis]|uniref:23S rRNA (pseudouridine(1915)-N(3))-methyltransferase RlmH n=1 Tax=Brackiella oedipodis TaxID=124225 RepID=UPI00048C9980|nr:23S rRNA (pseudouridine(1915)-N(3))-methyltransferase RlmH [Brackiella oedipodis]